MKNTEYRLGFLDIETTTDKGFPDYQNPVENIISIGYFDNYDNKTIMWIWHDTYKSEFEEKKYDVKNLRGMI